MGITREAAEILILHTYAEFYEKIRNLNGIARGNDNDEAREIRRIYSELDNVYGLTNQDDGATIRRKINESLNEDLSDVSNEELEEILSECKELARLYKLNIQRELHDIKIIEKFDDEESNKLREVRRYLERDDVFSRKVLADIDSGLIILIAYDDFRCVANDGSIKHANGFNFYNPDTIGFLIIERGPQQIAATIVHEYVHFTQKGKGMTLIDREFEALVESTKFIYRSIIRNRDITISSDIEQEQTRIIEESARKIVMEAYGSYREGEFEAILNNAYENITNPRIIRL